MYEVWYNLGILYEKCKQPEEGLIAYNKVLEIDRNLQSVHKRIMAIKSADYKTVMTKSQSFMNLTMIHPVYCLPNSLTILRKYQDPGQEI